MLMLGAMQMGLMAALVVVLVPMGMAGWHLSRNKMLFFSGALFITLAVGVHLTPFFPSVSDLVSSAVSSSVSVFDPRRHSCLSLLHDLVWRAAAVNASWSWSWSASDAVSSCGFQRLPRRDAADLLNGSWVVVAGDSQARLVALSLLTLLLEGDGDNDGEALAAARADLFRRHSDYSTVVAGIGMRLDFVWAPYSANITALIPSLRRGGPPDVVVFGAGLWHMLRVGNESDYGAGLRRVREAVLSLLPGPAGGRAPHLFWIGMPTLINSMLNTAEKRERMTDEMRGAYDRQLWQSKLLWQSGGPLLLLDVESLSWNCGVRCTEDGMHYHPSVYEAAVQIMLNALLIESHQKL